MVRRAPSPPGSLAPESKGALLAPGAAPDLPKPEAASARSIGAAPCVVRTARPERA
jgi:hypothetical protein